MMKDENFETKMETNKRKAWESFKLVITSFLGNKKEPNYKSTVEEMIKNFKILGCSMSFKVHFLDSHQAHFPENLGEVSEEQGERFHPDIKEMKSRSIYRKMESQHELMLDATKRQSLQSSQEEK
ncbi:hypothetical protein AVEN_253787-1 [Araneus ventricosus]|uniref:Uncharacterized protein n=1 Tax=Araneus ventricosus TaxID=182803 RepID=A0A4Y2IZV7_ARAVE|nr:hypothetical protein AVEN_253787-1 [Araneus ventricosus]